VFVLHNSAFWRVSLIVGRIDGQQCGLAGGARAQQSEMTFFVTSAGPGYGADLGGLEGADRHCQSLATAAGTGGRTWRAYLSTQAPASGPIASSWASSWNSSHPSLGCDPEGLRKTGGAGLLYCFAAQ
jgi:hypothetical protein